MILNNSLDNFADKKIENQKIDILIEALEDSFRIKITDNGGGISKEIIEDSMNGKLTAVSDKNKTQFKIIINKGDI